MCWNSAYVGDVTYIQHRGWGPDLLHFMLHIFPFSLIANLGPGATRYPGFNVSLFANCRACAIMSKHAGCDDDGLCADPRLATARVLLQPVHGCLHVASRSLLSRFLLSFCFCSPLSHAQISFHRSALAGRSSVTPVLLFGAVRIHLTRRQTCWNQQVVGAVQ